MQSKNAINILKKRDLMYLVKFIEITPLNGVVARFAESLLIKDVRPTLNTHEKLVPLKLFNWYDVCRFPLPCD